MPDPVSDAEPREATAPISVHVDVVSDVMCPWCFIGLKNLEAAIDTVKGINVETRWRPYQLDPTLPAEGKDRQTYLNEKFGGKERAQEIYRRVGEAGLQAGIEFAFDRIDLAPNTLNAHRVLHWAAGQGSDMQNRLSRRLFELYFLEGADIGDVSVLADAAEAAGMDREIVAGLLAGEDDSDAVRDEIAQAVSMQIQGVPFFILEKKYSLSGAQPPEVLANAIKGVAAELALHAQGGSAKGS